MGCGGVGWLLRSRHNFFFPLFLDPHLQPKDRANGKVLLTLTDTLQKHTTLRWTRKVVYISSFIKIVIHYEFSSGRKGSGTQTRRNR